MRIGSWYISVLLVSNTLVTSGFTSQRVSYPEKDTISQEMEFSWHSLTMFFITIQIVLKIHVATISLVVLIFPQTLVHAMAVQLSSHVQNCVMITSSEFGLKVKLNFYHIWTANFSANIHKWHQSFVGLKSELYAAFSIVILYVISYHKSLP